MPTPSHPAPTPVRYAYLLWLAVVAIGLVDAVASEVADPSTDFTGGLEIAVYIGVVVVYLAILALIVWLARRMRDGRNWARIVLTILTVLTLLGLRDIGQPLTGAMDVVGLGLSVLSVVLSVAAVVLSFVPRAAPWFRRTAIPA